MSRAPDSGALLVRALHRASRAAGCPLEIVASSWTGWSSATFTGARHHSHWQAKPSARLDAWLATLPDMEFDLGGHLVADLAVASIRRTAHHVGLQIEALTVEV